MLKRRALIKAFLSLPVIGVCGGWIGRAVAAVKPNVSWLPQPGDQLSVKNDNGKVVALRARDVPSGIKSERPMLAFPFDPKTKKLRDKQPFNGVLLLRFDLDQLDKEMQAVAADGVVAYSSTCVHAGCRIRSYIPKKKVFFCFCHGSEYYPLKDGEVAAGPAPRSLPNLPLIERDGVLVVAKQFSAPIGPYD